MISEKKQLQHLWDAEVAMRRLVQRLLAGFVDDEYELDRIGDAIDEIEAIQGMSTKYQELLQDLRDYSLDTEHGSCGLPVSTATALWRRIENLYTDLKERMDEQKETP